MNFPQATLARTTSLLRQNRSENGSEKRRHQQHQRVDSYQSSQTLDPHQQWLKYDTKIQKQGSYLMELGEVGSIGAGFMAWLASSSGQLQPLIYSLGALAGTCTVFAVGYAMHYFEPLHQWTLPKEPTDS